MSTEELFDLVLAIYSLVSIDTHKIGTCKKARKNHWWQFSLVNMVLTVQNDVNI